MNQNSSPLAGEGQPREARQGEGKSDDAHLDQLYQNLYVFQCGALIISTRDLRAAFERIAEMIRSVGLERTREPYVKHLGICPRRANMGTPAQAGVQQHKGYARQRAFRRCAPKLDPGLRRGTTVPCLKRTSTRHLQGKLWEMRLKGKDGIARSLYVTATGRRVVVLRTFVKKTEKTPRLELELALQRAKEIK